MTQGYHDLVARLRREVREVSVDDVATRLDQIPVLIDIREADEIRAGHIPGAVHVPRGVLEGAVERLDRSTEVVLYCSAGNRSVLAAKAMQDMGFTDVTSMAGGTMLWRMRGHPYVVPGTRADAGAATSDLSADEETRYARQLVLPQIGRGGQRRLGEASVLVVGAGGLGSPVALYLAAAGVGRISIADPDVVDVTNLQRQVVHDTSSLGRLKAESAAESMRRLNPTIAIEPRTDAISASNALDLLAGQDVVVDTTDNFPTRYLLNDASLTARVPLVHGSVFRFEGQVTVFDPYRGPCYRCLFPHPPPPELAPNCAEAGVLGSVTGIIGAIQATETLKLLTGAGDPLIGTLLTVDTLTQDWNRLEFERDPNCPACGPDEPPALKDYDATCAR